MIVGAVQPNGDAVVTLRLRGPRGTSTDLPVVVDTGFNDWLALPAAVIATLQLSFREEGRYTLANGSEATARIFTGEVLWHGVWRRVLVLEMDGRHLLGMGLLRDSHLGIAVRNGGPVEINPL